MVRNSKSRAFGRLAAAVVVLAALVAAPAAQAFDPALEAKNFAKTSEREQYVTLTPEFQSRLIQANTDNLASYAAIKANDPERDSSGNVCANGGQECAGDVRFYDWPDNGFGMREPVLFAARNGSTISGHVWATKSGPGKRPLIVITNGSVQAPEQLYWGQAATLAKHGYVVLTYDPQGQGRSDTGGEGVDRSTASPPRRVARSTTTPRTRSTSRSRPPTPPTTRARAAPPGPTTRRSRTGASPPASTPPTTRTSS